MRILVTGGAGYIGSHVVKLLLEQRHDVTIFDNLSRGHQGAIDALRKVGEFDFIDGDLTMFSQISSVFENKRIDVIIHLAGLCSVDESMKDPASYFNSNAGGTFNLLKAMTQAGTDKIIFSSTCAVYGESQYLPLDEKHPQGYDDLPF